MKNRRTIVVLAAAIVAFTLLACDARNLVAFVRPTQTPTRTPRPTFTPRPSVSPTPEDSPTPEATETRAATATPTRRPATRAPTPKPTTPPQPPQPTFEYHREPGQGFCPTGAPVFEIKGRVKAGGSWAGGIHIVVLDKSGKVVAQTNSRYEIELNPEWGVSCWQEKNLYNYQLDATAGWYDGPLTLRLTRSATDLTPISTDETITFDSKGGRWYIDWIK